MENFSSCNLIFFLDILIGKMEASEHSEVSGFALDLKKNLVLHFSNLDIQEKYQITLGKIFHTLRQNNAWRKVPFLTRILKHIGTQGHHLYFNRTGAKNFTQQIVYYTYNHKVCVISLNFCSFVFLTRLFFLVDLLLVDFCAVEVKNGRKKDPNGAIWLRKLLTAHLTKFTFKFQK